MSERSNRKLILPVGDSRLNEFVRRAGPIVTAERGLNDRSRIKLRALAADLKMPGALYDLALEYFQQSGIEPGDKLPRFERQFWNWLEKHFRKQKQQILSTELEKSCLELGTAKYQLSVDRARQLVHDVAREIGMQRVSIKEAESYIKSLVDEQIGSATVLNEQLRERLRRAASSWGVEHETVEDFITLKLAENTAANSRTGAPKRTIALGICAIIIGLSLYFFSLNQRRQLVREVDSRKHNALSEKKQTGVELLDGGVGFESNAPVSNARWDASATARMLEARRNNPLIDKYWNVWVSDKVDSRIALTRNLLDNLDPEQPEYFEQVCEVQALMLDIETDPEVSKQLIANLSSQVLIPYSRLPENIDSIKQTFAGNQLLYFVWQQTEHNSQNRRLLGVAIFAQIGFDPDTFENEATSGTYLQLSNRSLARQWLDAFASVAQEDSSRAIQLLEPLRKLASGYVDEELLNSRIDDAMLSILRTHPEHLSSLKHRAEAVLSNNDIERLGRWNELLWSTQNEELRTWLSLVLARKLNLDLDMGTDDQMLVIRQRLNDNLIEPLISRHKTFIQWMDSNKELRELVQSNELPPVRLQVIANVSSLATRALALSQDKIDLYNSLVAQRLPLLSETILNGKTEELVILGAEPHQARQIHLETLSAAISSMDEESNSAVEKLNAFKRLLSVADRFADLDMRSANVVIDFLLKANSDAAVILIRKELHLIRHWTSLQLSLLEQLYSTEAEMDHVLTIAGLLSNRKLEIDAKRNWREEIHVQMLTSVAENNFYLSALQNQNDQVLWNTLEEYLASEMKQRASILDVSVDGHGSYLSLIEHLCEAMSNEPLEKDWTKNRFVASHELHEAILSGRSLVEHTAHQLKLRSPQIDSKIAAVQSWHANQADKLSKYDDQLLLNELTLLKLWAIACEAN